MLDSLAELAYVSGGLARSVANSLGDYLTALADKIHGKKTALEITAIQRERAFQFVAGTEYGSVECSNVPFVVEAYTAMSQKFNAKYYATSHPGIGGFFSVGELSQLEVMLKQGKHVYVSVRMKDSLPWDLPTAAYQQNVQNLETITGANVPSVAQ